MSTPGFSPHPNTKSEVRGAELVITPALLAIKLLAACTDLGWIGLVGFGYLRLRIAAPSTATHILLGALLLIVLYWMISTARWGATLGQRLWKLQRYSKTQAGGSTRWLPARGWDAILKGELYQSGSLDSSQITTWIAVTLCLLGAQAELTNRLILAHPYWLKTEETRLTAYAPFGVDDQNWIVAPFFYILGAWPNSFENQPILYSLPYEQGPPTHFVGHIQARWKSPEILVTFTGPYTPPEAFTREQIKSCFTGSLWKRAHCLALKRAYIGKSIREMNAQIAPESWSMSWVTIENSALSDSERPEAIRITGVNHKSGRLQDRVVFLLEGGTSQSVILDRPSSGPSATRAAELFDQAIRSQRVSNSLSPGRAWADREIQQTHLALAHDSHSSGDLLRQMSHLQAILLSKISVEPRGYDAFYHLGGVSILFAREAHTQKNAEWSAIAKPLIKSAHLYAEDIAPKDPRTLQLENLWLEVKGY